MSACPRVSLSAWPPPRPPASLRLRPPPSAYPPARLRPPPRPSASVRLSAFKSFAVLGTALDVRSSMRHCFLQGLVHDCPEVPGSRTYGFSAPFQIRQHSPLPMPLRARGAALRVESGPLRAQLDGWPTAKPFRAF
eukprot:5619125-Alexandrium_andersonii.AAC.1